jgi:hypothetical protein
MGHYVAFAGHYVAFARCSYRAKKPIESAELAKDLQS